MIAKFDLKKRVPTYDFFTWMVHCKLLGATEITFCGLQGPFKMQKRWPDTETQKRYENYLKPGPALADLPSRVSEEGDWHMGTHQVQTIWRDLQALGKPLPRLRSVHPHGTARYTVTIRETWYKPERNSDVALWTEFAKRIDALVIWEYDKAPLSLYRRMAYYAGAKMNFGVPNGPLGMLLVTPYPVTMVCDPATTAHDWNGQGVGVGEQVPWALSEQRLVWERPTMDVLMREYERCEGPLLAAS